MTHLITRRIKFILVFFIFITILSCQFNNKDELKINGRIEADETNLAFKLPGKLSKINIEEGDNISKGFVIAELQSNDIKARLKQAIIDEKSSQNLIKIKTLYVETLKKNLNQLLIKRELLEKTIENKIKIAKNRLKSAKAKSEIDNNNFSKAKTNLKKLEKDLTRYKYLFDEKAIPKNKFEEIERIYNMAKNDFKSAEKIISISKENVKNAEGALQISIDNKKEIDVLESKIQSLKTNIAIAEEELKITKNNNLKVKEIIKEVQSYNSDTRIEAPANLIILRKFSQTGEIVAAGQPIATGYEPSKLYFRGYLPEPYLGNVKIGMKGKIIIDSYNNKKFEGTLIYISNRSEFTPKEVQTVGERVKQVFLIKVKVNNKKNILKPGMPADYILKLK